MHGNAKHTSGGLEKKDLMMNKRGRIVSRKKSKTAKKQKRLEKAGFKAKKGTFKLFKKRMVRLVAKEKVEVSTIPCIDKAMGSSH